MATAKSESKISRVKAYYAAHKDPMSITHAELETALKTTLNISLYYAIKAKFRKGPAKYDRSKGKKKNGEGADKGTEAAAGDAPVSKSKRLKQAMRDQEFLEYMMWMNAGLRKGWFDLYVTSNTTDLTKLRAAFDANHG